MDPLDGGLVDVHSHIYPRVYLERLARERHTPRVRLEAGGELLDIFGPPAAGCEPPAARPIGPEFWDPEAKLAYMDRVGIQRSVISLGNPWLDFLRREEEAAWSRRLNDELAAICAASSDRLFFLAVLPLSDPAAARAELRRVAALPQAVGVVLPAKPRGAHLDSLELAPLWSALETLDFPAMMHPHYATGGADLCGFGSTLMVAIGFPFETTAAVTRLIYAGVLDAFPRLRLMLSHAGGTLPFLAGRLDEYSRGQGLPRPVSAYVRSLYFDALMYEAGALQCAVDFAGLDRLFFGTDHPFGVQSTDANLRAYRMLPNPGHRAAVGHANATRFFRLPQPSSAGGRAT